MSVDVAISDLSVVLGGATILDRVSLAARPGEFLALLGPSGSGKTTLLNVVAGFIRQSAGTVAFDGAPVDALSPRRRDVGFVFQSYALFPTMSVGENVAFPLRARRIGAAERRARVAEALELVHLGDAAGRPVASLSGGQQQRVALARALVYRPRLLLLDEPLAALDKRLREAMQVEIKRIQREVGVTTIAVTHDQTEAFSMADRVAILHDGRLEQVGPPEELYRRPATLFAARFLGEANLLPAGGRLAAALGVDGAGAGTAVLRPEDVELCGPEVAGVAAIVEQATYQATRFRLVAAVPDEPGASLLVSAPHTAPPDLVRPGAPVRLQARPGSAHVVPESAEDLVRT